MMMRDSWLGEVAKCILLLTPMGVLWSLPFVRGETCNSNLKIRPVVDISSSSENNSLPIGASLTLTCTAEPRRIDSGYMDRWVDYVEWYDPQGRQVGAKCQQPSNIHAHKLKLSCPLVLKDLTVDKFGRYTCQAGNGYLKHCTRKPFEIEIQGNAPELVEVPRNQSAAIGANVTFNCNATGLPNPSISWIKDNDSFALKSNPRVKLINNLLGDKSIQSQLLITGMKKEDFGKYQCEAKNSVGKAVSLPASLTPKGSGKPEIVEHPRSQTYSVGSDLVFSCTATGLPKPNITWIKNNDPNVTKTNPRFKTILVSSDTKYRSMLLIKEAKKEDAGTYQCFVNNSAGEKTSNVAFLHLKEASTHSRLQQSSTVQIAIAVAASCVVITVIINGVLGLWWYMRCKRGKKPEGQTKVVRVHMSNGKCETVLFAQDAVEAPSLGTKNVGKIEERSLLFSNE